MFTRWGKVGRKFLPLKTNFPFMRFTGTIHARLDAKNRVFLPSAYRKVLAETGAQSFVMKRDIFQPCLVLYPYDVWEHEVEELKSRLNLWSSADAMLLRQFLSDVEVFELDTNGRFILPKRHQECIGAHQEVTFVGLDDRLEVWSKEHLDASFMPAEDFASALQSKMSSL